MVFREIMICFFGNIRLCGIILPAPIPAFSCFIPQFLFAFDYIGRIERAGFPTQAGNGNNG